MDGTCVHPKGMAPKKTCWVDFGHQFSKKKTGNDCLSRRLIGRRIKGREGSGWEKVQQKGKFRPMSAGVRALIAQVYLDLAGIFSARILIPNIFRI